jgi:hypothetical protein
MRHMLEDPADMTPDQRRQEIAAILARGVLRLPRSGERSPISDRSPMPQKTSESSQNCLDEFATSSPDVTAG